MNATLTILVEAAEDGFVLPEAARAVASRAGSLLALTGVPATVLGVKNANGRTYAVETMRGAVEAARSNGLFVDRRLLCTADGHPNSSYPNPSNASHVVTDARVEERGGRHVLVNDWLVLDTAQGRNLKALVEAGIGVGTSIRGLGRQDEQTGEIKDYSFLGCDAVGLPSAGTYARFDGAGVKAEALTEAADDAKAPKGEAADVARARREAAETLATTFKEDHAKVNYSPLAVLDHLFALETDAAGGGLPLAAFEGIRRDVYDALSEQIGTEREYAKGIYAKRLAEDAAKITSLEAKLAAAEKLAEELAAKAAPDAATEARDAALSRVVDDVCARARAASALLVHETAAHAETRRALFTASGRIVRLKDSLIDATEAGARHQRALDLASDLADGLAERVRAAGDAPTVVEAGVRPANPADPTPPPPSAPRAGNGAFQRLVGWH